MPDSAKLAVTMARNPQSVLILGASGMLGNAVFRHFNDRTTCTTLGTVRSKRALELFGARYRSALIPGIDVEDPVVLEELMTVRRPDVIINCVGLVKQLKEAQDPVAAVSINSLLPHRLAKAASRIGARLVHLSTDCVFTGDRGMYREDDLPDAADMYGRSKLLGEVIGPGCVTLRTSIIGHELGTSHSLISWFLSQPGPVNGFRRAVFSGLPAGEIARVIERHVLPNPELAGLWHLSANPIDKHGLLSLVAEVYGRSTVIHPKDSPVIDRSLDSSRFRARTGYSPPPWPQLIRDMSEFG
jgi:dTDP-4-dehydrorhamnose reductase